ncbi:transposase [Archangium violaceum]|uniref:transposase n=1 Tax=Archangium violaceum TaxID=83451 RepID=UPI0035E3CC18
MRGVVGRGRWRSVGGCPEEAAGGVGAVRGGGVERLCRYGARGRWRLEWLLRAQDGRIAWRMQRPLPDDTTHLFFTGLELLRRLTSLMPPPRRT